MKRCQCFCRPKADAGASHAGLDSSAKEHLLLHQFVVDGLVGGMMVEQMLDSGFSVSLVRYDIAKLTLQRDNKCGRYAKAKAGLGRRRRAPHCEQRQGDSEAKRHRRGTRAQFHRGGTADLSTSRPWDFLQQKGLVLEFTTSPVSVTVARQKRPTTVSTVPGPAPLPESEALQVIWKAERERRAKV